MTVLEYLTAFGKVAQLTASQKQAIQTAKALDLSYVPEDLREDLAESFDKAEESLTLMSQIAEAEAAVAVAAVDYRPLHVTVRAIERDIRRIDERITDLELIVRRSGEGQIYSAARGERATRQIEDLKTDRAVSAKGPRLKLLPFLVIHPLRRMHGQR